MDMSIIAASRLRKPPFIASLFIGGVDATKYADAQGFSDNFKAQHDPTNPVVIPVSDILNYQTEPDGNGRLNIAAEIAGNFEIPNQVFDNNIGSSGSSIIYFVDSQGLATELGTRLFDTNPNFEYLLTNSIQTISARWLSFTIADVPRVLDFEDAINIEDTAFSNYRNPNDRINIRNATNIIADPATDNIFSSYNLNNRTAPKKVIYVHPSLQTINNGNPLNSLQSAINNGADVRYVTNKNVPSNFQSGDVTFNVGSIYIDFTITPPASNNGIDYYDVFILDESDPNNIVRRLFPFKEITDINTLIRNLEPNKNYKIEIQAVDVFFNKNERFDLGIITTPQLPTQFQNAVAYYKLDETSGDAIDVVNGYNGTLFGGVTQGVAGKIGTGYSFDGTNGSVNFGNDDIFSFTDEIHNIPFALRVWINPRDISTNPWIFKKDGGGSGNREIITAIVGNEVRFLLFDSSNNLIRCHVNFTVPLNQWTMITFIKGSALDNSDMQIAINQNILTNNQPLQIYNGNHISDSDFVIGEVNNYDGLIDEALIIRNEDWTAAKVLEDYNNGNGTTI